MHTTTTAPTEPRPTARRVPWRVDAATAGAATVCALVAWLFVAVLPGVDLVVRAGAGTVTVGGPAIALTAAAAALVGMAVLRLLERLTARAVGLWSCLVVGAALLSVVGPLGAETVAATGALLTLHAVVTAVVLAAGRRSRR
jgi:Family of unknown function (DUF6069)